MPVLNQLYARKKVVLEFESAEIRENFRQALYKIKKVQDQHLMDVLDERREVLKFVFTNPMVALDSEGLVQDVKYIATLYLEEAKEINFTVVSIEDISAKESNGSNTTRKTSQEVPDSLGEVDRESREASTDLGKVGEFIQENSESSMERKKPGPS